MLWLLESLKREDVPVDCNGTWQLRLNMNSTGATYSLVLGLGLSWIVVWLEDTDTSHVSLRVRGKVL